MDLELFRNVLLGKTYREDALRLFAQNIIHIYIKYNVPHIADKPGDLGAYQKKIDEA